jgi:transcriptional regulator with XRE-family HTH domain
MSLLSYARRSAGFSQRELAMRSGIPQPAIARIESGRSTPRLDTIASLLRACGLKIGLEPAAGEGVDRTAIRRLRRLTPAERAEIAVREAHNLEGVIARSQR